MFETTLTSQVARWVKSKFSDGRPVLDLALLKKLHLVVDSSDQGADTTREVLSRTQQLIDISIRFTNLSSRAIGLEKMITPTLQTLSRFPVVPARWDRLEKIFLSPGWPMLKLLSFAIVIRVQEENGSLKRALESMSQRYLTGLTSSKTFDFLFSVQEILQWDSYITVLL
jgi:hypothetical protein